MVNSGVNPKPRGYYVPPFSPRYASTLAIDDLGHIPITLHPAQTNINDRVPAISLRPDNTTMLHRRTTSSAPAGSNSSAALNNQQPNVNKAYTPLRRPSQTLYNTPQSSSSKARYNLPSPSPAGPNSGLYVNTGPSSGIGGQGYFPSARSSIDLGDEAFPTRSHDWAKYVRVGLERMRMGLRDGLKLDRSLGLVWG